MEDAQIVSLYWQRNPDAISETDLKYGKYCSTIAWNICHNHEDADECVNDTWLRAWNAMPDKKPAFLSPFLGKITRNLALNRLEAASRKKRGGTEVDLALEELEEVIASDENLEAQIEHKELEAAINRFLAGLNDTERRVFLGRYWYLMPVTELSDRTAFSQSKVKSMLYRTRMKLRTYLSEEGYL